jgi:hypothetical protein
LARKLIFVLLVLTVAFCNSYSQLRVPSLQVSDKLADTTFIFKTSVYTDTGLIWKRLKVGVFMVDSATGRDTGKVAVRDTVKAKFFTGRADTSSRTDSLKYGTTYKAGTSYLRSDVADTAAGDYSLWLGHYGTRVDSSGIFSFPFPILNPFSQGWQTGISPWCNIKQDSNTVFDVQLMNGSVFSVDRGGKATTGFRVWAYSTGDDSVYAKASMPLSIYRKQVTQYNDHVKGTDYPFSVYSVGGDTVLAAVVDNDTNYALQVFNRAGTAKGKYGIKTVTQELKIESSDSLTASHAADTTFFNTTARAINLNKNLYLDSTCWDDIRIAGSQLRNGATAPSFGVGKRLGGIYVLSFTGATGTDDIHTAIQLPHTWKPNTTIYAHVHGAAHAAITGAQDTISCGIEYAFLSLGDTLLTPENCTDTITGYWHISADSLRRHSMLNIGAITPTGFSGTSKKESSMLMIRLFRNTADVKDTYTGNFEIYEFDIHFQVHKMGTKNELSD